MKEGEDGPVQAPVPRDPSDVIRTRVLSALLVAVLFAFAFYVLVAEGVLDLSPPYPSEDTPLKLQAWGLTWDREYELTIEGLDPGLNYSDLSISLTRYEEGSVSGWASAFVLTGFVDVEDFVPPDTVEGAIALGWLGHSISGADGVETHVITGYFVSDRTDPWNFNIGDSISLVHLVFADGELSHIGFEEDVVYEVEVVYDGAGTAYEGYGFAVQGGDLYSWVDHGPVDDPLS